MIPAKLFLYRHDRTTRVFLPFILFLYICPMADNAYPLEMLTDIVQPVSTEFGTYVPIPVEAQPSVPSNAPAADLSNVANLALFSLSLEEKTLLAKNGFVVTPSAYGEMHDIYEVALENNLPLFVSVDLVLHSFHEVYDHILKTLETQRFRSELNELTQTLLAASQSHMQHAMTPSIQEAAHLNTAYFALAAKLLDPDFAVPSEVQNQVEQEWELIQAHAGVEISPLFGYGEDYSQYLPRGHYTQSDELKRYFQAMMWYGRMAFRADESIVLTQSALLIVQSMQNLSVTNEPALAVWERIYQPTVFFVGKSDDWTLNDYHTVALDIYGENFDNLPPDTMADEALLNQFIEGLKALPQPRINTPISGSGLRFMGQRFIPDSYIMDNLAEDKVDMRLFPKGLDVMAALGSQRADRILDEVYQENKNPDYVSQMTKMKAEFSALEPQVWAQNVYWNWLYCLMPLLAEKGAGFPFYMQNNAWRDKELSSALGSWAELRHDTILYAKQSGGATGIPPSKSFAWEGVEPNPWAFARLAALCRFTRDGLERLGLLVDEARSPLESLESLTLFLQTVAEKELSEQPLTVAEKSSLRFIGSRVSGLIPQDWQGETIKASEDMAVIADVHTEFNSSTVLEVGVGRPLNLYVVVNAGDRLLLAVGSVFSYHEFLWPMNDRLTDEAWRKMLSEGNVPSLSSWMESYMDIAAIKPYPVEEFRSHGVGWEGQINVTHSPTAPKRGDVIKISVDVRVPSYPQVNDLQVEVIVNDGIQILPLKHNGSTSTIDNFIIEISTKNIPAGTNVKLTLYSPSVIAIGHTVEFILGEGAGVREWEVY